MSSRLGEGVYVGTAGRRFLGWAASVLMGWLVLMPAPAGATDTSVSQPISINIVVTSDTNSPVAGAIVELRRDGQAVAGSSTDLQGRVTLQVPGAGSYVLTVRKKDYLISEAAYEVKPGPVQPEVGVVVTPNALSQQNVTVQGTPANPVEEVATISGTVAPTQAKDTPSRPTTLKDALPLIPGVVRANDGTVGIAGYNENHSTLLINSVDVTDPATGDFGLSVPIDTVETISVSEMPYLAQYGRFIAGVVAAETRRGTEKWTFSLNDPLPEFRIRSGHLVGMKTASPRLNFSGPLIANRLYFSEGGEYLLYKQAVRTLPFPFNETRSAAINSFTQLDAIVSPKQTITASFHLAPHDLDYVGLNFFNPQPVTPNASFHESTGTVIHRLSFGGGTLQSTFATIHVSSGIRPQGDAAMVLAPTGNQGNYFSRQSRRASRFEWMENWAPRALHFKGEHIVQMGSLLTHSEDRGEFHAQSVEVRDLNNRTLQRTDFSAGRPFDLSDYGPALYLQDHWVMGPQFALDFGSRLEAQTITATWRAAPRGGFVWSPDKQRKTVIRGGAGVFYDSVPLSTYAFGRYPRQTVTSFDEFGNIVGLPIHYINTTDQKPKRGFPFIERGSRNGNFAPYSLAWNLGLERDLHRALTVRFKYLESKAEDIISLRPQVILGQNALVLGSSTTARTRQYEFTAKVGTDAKRQFFFSYVRQRAKGDLTDGSSFLANYPFPVVRSGLFASMPNEVPNRFLLWGTFALPKKMQINPHIEYRNGFPYQPTNVLQQYVPQAGAQPRFPRYFACDLLVSKDFQIGKKHAIRFSVPLLNVTNHFNPLEVHSNTADPQYGRFFGNYQRRVLLDFDVLY